MVKLVALYKKPDNIAEFDKHYEEVHTPLVKEMPGLQRLEVSRIYGAAIGEPSHYLIAEMYFETRESLDSALASSEGRAAGKDLMGFAAKYVTLFYADIAGE